MNHFTFKDHINDFIVEETLPYKLTGTGKLYYLYIQKSGLSTGELLAKITRYTGIKRPALGICWLKDKRGMTRQRISIYKRDINESIGLKKFVDFLSSFTKVLELTEDDRFLTMWSNRGNRFLIKLRPITSQDLPSRQAKVVAWLDAILQQWVPNYFWEQRFGTMKNNRKIWQDLITGVTTKIRDDVDSPQERSFKIQAFSSYVFNKIVEQRAKDNTLKTKVDGDILEGELITAPVYGNDLKRPKAWTASYQLEEKVFKEFGINDKTAEYCQRLKIRWLRRPIVMTIHHIKHRTDNEGNIILNVELSSGSYASTFLEQRDQLITRQIHSDKSTSSKHSSSKPSSKSPNKSPNQWSPKPSSPLSSKRSDKSSDKSSVKPSYKPPLKPSDKSSAAHPDPKTKKLTDINKTPNKSPTKTSRTETSRTDTSRTETIRSKPKSKPKPKTSISHWSKKRWSKPSKNIPKWIVSKSMK